MTIVLIILHILVCLFLVGVVLLQTGKRADLAGAFGGGGSQTAFGTRGAATLLTKATTIGAVLFMVTSIGLSVMASRKTGGGSSVLPDSGNTPAGQTDSGGAGDLPPLPVDDPVDGGEGSPDGDLGGDAAGDEAGEAVSDTAEESLEESLDDDGAAEETPDQP